MFLEEMTKPKIRKISKSELFSLRLRAIQLYEKYSEIEKKEILVKIDWDDFYKRYKLVTDEFNKRNYNFTRGDVDKILAKEKYFGLKIIEKHEPNLEKCFAILAQIGKSNILIHPEVGKDQVPENINGVIVAKSVPNNWEKIKDYSKIPIYAVGRNFDKISSNKKHLFIKSLKIGKNQAIIRPIKITYKKKSPSIGLLINKKDTKISILPKFLSLAKDAQDLVKDTVWVCEVEKYDKDNSEKESKSFVSLMELAKTLKPKKIFIVNASEDLLKHKDEINQELKKWQGRILYGGDTLEEDEIMRGLVWGINDSEKSLDSLDSITKSEQDRVAMEVDFNGVRARVEKKENDVVIMVNPDSVENSPLQSKKLPLQVDEIQSFRDDFIGDATIIVTDEGENECLGEEKAREFIKQKTGYETQSKKVHIFISDLLKLNSRDIREWTFEKRKKMMNYFGNREHVHFVKTITDIEKNSLSYIINKKEAENVFQSIIKVSKEGKFYPKNIAKGILVKSLDSPYSAERISISKPETTENYVRIPVNTKCKITATIDISTEKGIKALYCGGK